LNEIPAYRLVKSKWKDNPFDGEGARRFGGRWNSHGKSCIYAAGSVSLAILEIMVHLEDHRLLASYILFELRLPESAVAALAQDQLPQDWDAPLAGTTTAQIGDQWLSRREDLALAVPSAVVPMENNFIINPEHPAFGDLVKRAKAIPFTVDPRLV